MPSFMSLRSYRPPDLQPDRIACNWVLISAALAIGFHLPRVPLWLGGFALALLAWRYFIENHAWRIPGRSVRWLLLLVTAVAVFREYGTLLGRDAGVAFLALLVAQKILEIRSLRDYLLAVFLIYLLLLGLLLFSQSMFTGALVLAGVFVTTHTLLLLNRPAEARRAPNLGVTALLVLQALPLMLVFYLLFPRIQGSLWGLPQDAFEGRTGMSEQVSPGSVARLYNDYSVAFRAEFEEQPPPPAVLYWRAMVLSDTDGTTWSRHTGPGDGSTDSVYETTTNPLAYSVFVEPHRQKWVPSLGLPTAVDRASGLAVAPGYVLRSTTPITGLRRYDLSSHMRYNTGGLDRLQTLHNTQWPAEPSQRVAALLDQWLSPPVTPELLIDRVLDHFHQNPFHYTLAPPPLSGDVLDQFLFQTKAGFCEHYASSFAALMRLSGIPARLVVGYLGGEWNDQGNYMIVRQSDAHAWVEVWLPGRGWTLVDPTAAVAPERIELGSDALRRLIEQETGLGSLSIEQARRLSAPSWGLKLWQEIAWRWDAINVGWDRWVMAYGPGAQRELLRLLGVQTPSWLKQVFIMTVALAGVLFLFSLVWLLTRRPFEDPVAKVYNRFCAKLERAGFRRKPVEGPLDFAHRVASSRDDLRKPVYQITRNYISLRYGHFTQTGFVSLKRMVSDFECAN